VTLTLTGICLDLFRHDVGVHGPEDDDGPRLAWGYFLPGQTRPAIQLGPCDDRIGIAVALNAPDDFLEPLPNMRDSMGKFRRWDNKIDLWLDAKLGELPGGRLAVITFRRAVA
jgi:hypothetical protein